MQKIITLTNLKTNVSMVHGTEVIVVGNPKVPPMVFTAATPALAKEYFEEFETSFTNETNSKEAIDYFSFALMQYMRSNSI